MRRYGLGHNTTFLTASFVISIKNEVTQDRGRVIVFDLTIKTPNGGWGDTLNDVKRSLDYPNNFFRCAFGSFVPLKC